MNPEITAELHRIHKQLQNCEYDRNWLLAEQAEHYGEFIDQLWALLNDDFHEV